MSAMTTRMVTKQRPSIKPQGRKQRLDWKSNPVTGLPWGQPGWPGGAEEPEEPPE